MSDTEIKLTKQQAADIVRFPTLFLANVAGDVDVLTPWPLLLPLARMLRCATGLIASGADGGAAGRQRGGDHKGLQEKVHAVVSDVCLFFLDSLSDRPRM